MTVDLHAHIRAESARFVEVLGAVEPTARVPSCPEWDAGELAHHLAGVHDFWTRIVRDRITDEAAVEALEASKPARPGSYADLLDLCRRATAGLLDALAGADDAEPVWTWAPEHTVGFVRRFQAHEALMHRVDAELTAGALTPLPVELAADGVSVVLGYSMAWRPEWARWTPTGGVGRLRATDTGDEWTVALGGWSGTSPDSGRSYQDRPSVELRDGGDPTFTVSAPAADLDAWLWHRPGFGEVSVSGDSGDYERFHTQVAAGVQ